jgi:hypothetical protein
LRQGRIGQRYILGGQNVSLAQMLGDIARLVDWTPPMSVLNGARNMITDEAMLAAAAADGGPPLGSTLGGTIEIVPGSTNVFTTSSTSRVVADIGNALHIDAPRLSLRYASSVWL